MSYEKLGHKEKGKYYWNILAYLVLFVGSTIDHSGIPFFTVLVGILFLILFIVIYKIFEFVAKEK